MICSSTSDVLCTSARASDVAVPTTPSLVEGPRETQAEGASEDAFRRYERKLLTPPEELLSVRSSVVSNASASDRKRDQGTARLGAASASAPSPSARSTTSASGFRSKSRLEQKIKMITHYIKTLSVRRKQPHSPTGSGAHGSSSSASSSRRRRTSSKADARQVRGTKRSSQQNPSPRVTVEEVHDKKQQKSRSNDVSSNSSNMTVRCSVSSHYTPLSWDDLYVGDSLVEKNEVMPASPRSRKRGRCASELFCETELRRLCVQCEVPSFNVNDAVKMVLSSFGTCHFDVTMFHDLVGGNSVVFIGMLVFACIDCGGALLDIHRLPAFLHHIQTRYNEHNPFHNACHAADVLHSLFLLLWNTQLGQRIAIHNQIGVLFAAVMHDIEHTGLTNDFLLKTNHEIAVKYATAAPMEEMHMAVAVDVITDPRFDVLAKMTNDQQEQVLGIVCDTIRSTALCYQKDLLRDVASVAVEEWGVDNSEAVLSVKLQTLALRIAMHVSDISQTMKPFAIHAKWVARLNEELFLQGDLDRQMCYGVCPDSCFRENWTTTGFLKSQIWFLQNLALPACQGLNGIPWMKALMLEDNLHANIAQWDSQL